MTDYEIGIHEGISFEEYLKIPALSSTEIGWFEESPASYLFKRGNEPRETPPMKLGSALHCKYLEPDQFLKRYEIEPDFEEWGRVKAKAKELKLNPKAVGPVSDKPRSTEMYKARVLEREEAGFTVLQNDAWHDCRAMDAALRSDPDIDPIYQKASAFEVVVIWERDGLLCKARLDMVNDEDPCLCWIGDAKSTGDLPRFTPQAVTRYRIYRQGAWYISGLNALGRTVGTYYLPVVANYAPYETALFRLSATAIEAGFKEIEGLWSAYRMCKASKEFPPHFGPGVHVAEIEDRRWEQIFNPEPTNVIGRGF